MNKVQYINHDLLRSVYDNAVEAPRKRKNYNFHHESDRCQRMLNAIEPRSYIPPHCHGNPPKDEGILLLQGKGVAFIFKEDGSIQDIYPLDPTKEQWGIDVPAGVFHTVIALVSPTVFYESKRGPFDPAQGKELAPWAPNEGSEKAQAYLDYLHQTAATMDVANSFDFSAP